MNRMQEPKLTEAEDAAEAARVRDDERVIFYRSVCDMLSAPITIAMLPLHSTLR